MPECECLAGCPFFNDRMPGIDALVEATKLRFCLGDYASCARYQVFARLGMTAVPTDLYPMQQSRVKPLLDQALNN